MEHFLEIADRVLEFLRDIHWHFLDEIHDRVASENGSFEQIINFLEENEFIILDNDEKMAQIKPKGLRFLKLPAE